MQGSCPDGQRKYGNVATGNSGCAARKELTMKLEDLTQDKLDELLGNLETLTENQKVLKSDLTKLRAKAKGAEIDPDVHAELQTKVEDLTNQLGKVQKESTKQIETLTKQLGEKEGAVSKYLIDSQLSDSLAKVGVKKEFMEAAKALLKGQAIIKADNGEYQALIGDKPITDAIKEWATGEQGKHFVLADANSGGGAGGDGGGGGTQQKTKGKIDGTEAERAAYFAEKFPDLTKKE